MNLTILINGTSEDEKGLYDNDKEMLIVKGDYYHIKIDDRIEGIIQGIEYCGIEVNLNKLTIYPTNELFNKYNFYDNQDD
jgi:hypothetical protein